MMFKQAQLLSFLLLLVSVPTFSDASDPDLAVDFAERVLPLLKTHCYECHSHESGEAEGGLVLDSKQGWQQGGNSGAAVVPGKPSESLLIRAIEYQDESLQMPPDGQLPKEAIAVFEKWIEHDAYDPRDGNTSRPKQEAVANHWAFQPVRSVAIPIVEDTDWPRTSVDRFILRQLQREEMQPAEDAGDHRWLRRVTFDLTGFPPTVDEIGRFLADDTPERYDAVVDRLLATEAYGERWARHWLDVVRYADSNGGGVNVVHDDAWRYRDWVISAFNEDLPYDQFVQQQIAGDLLPADNKRQRADQIVATGMLMLGAKPLAKYDKQELKLDVADEQIDTVGRAVLGLTLGCARCHDHKFDPVTARDYYALAGIFTSTRTLLERTKGGPISQLHTVPLPINDKGQPWEKELAERNASALAVGETSRPHDEAIRRRGLTHAKGVVVPRGVVSFLADGAKVQIPQKQSGRLELARWLTSPQQPLVARVYVNRVWRHLFGEGLVASEDNFGTTGLPPSHPELLDFLASDFVKRDWSTKQLIRQLVLSRTYRQTSSPKQQDYSERDPDNRLLWRMNVRRLDVEAIRDGMLVASGQLDARRGGPVMPWTGRLNANGQMTETKVKVSVKRRGVYLPIIRDGMTLIDSMDMFSTFDFADPSMVIGDRHPTTVPAQALFLLNSRFVADLSDACVTRNGQTKPDRGDRVRNFYLGILNRPATEDEVSAALRFVDSFAADPEQEQHGQQKGWSCLCQSLFASNDFLFLK